MIRATSSSTPDTYAAVRHRAGLIDRSDRGRLVVSGKDRASYLQGLVTNDVTGLSAGRGCYAAYLTPQGRMITDLWVYELGDVILVSLPIEVKDAVLAKLDQFVFTEDVQLGDVTASFASLVVAGPEAGALVAALLDGVDASVLAALPLHGNVRATRADRPAIVLRVDDAGEPGYEVLVAAEQHDALRAALIENGAVAVDPLTAEAIRVEAGIPRFHRDMDEETIPLEAGIEDRAISLTKGCYVGQEVIIRVLHRGHGRVARRLVGLTLEGDAPPAPGAAVAVDAKDVGRITSAVWSPALEQPIALASLHRDVVQPGTAVRVGEVAATVTALPFVGRPG